jgi:hypothetical protein
MRAIASEHRSASEEFTDQMGRPCSPIANRENPYCSFAPRKEPVPSTPNTSRNRMAAKMQSFSGNGYNGMTLIQGPQPSI